jgi:hypothetical protein
MIIRVERSGGFAGMSQRAVIDTDQLEPQERQELLGLVESSKFFDTHLDTGSSSTQPGADRFHYTITIERGQQRRTVELGEGDIPENWQPLIQRINALARRFRSQ